MLVTINDGLFICCCSVLDFTGQRCSISRGGSLWIMTLYQQTYCSAYWAPPICSGPFYCIFKYFHFSYFPASCRELQLAYCILSMSATNLFTAAENCCELVSAEESSDIRFLSCHSDTFFEVLSDISAILCRFVPLLTPTFMVHVGCGSVEQKWESKLCQSYGDFELNVAHPMTKPDWNLWAALINQDAAFDAV